MIDYSITVIGGGAMGTALISGLMESGVDPGLLTLASPHPGRLTRFADAGVRVMADNAEAARDARVVIAAVKPWVLPAVARELGDSRGGRPREVCAIAAGVSVADLQGMFPADDRLCLAMPNTAMRLRRSMTFLVKAAGEYPAVREIFDAVGRTMIIEEHQLPGATALASCGIAYAMRYVRAAMEGGVEAGFRASDAQRIITATLRGACALLDQPDAHPESEIDSVTTPGGLTIRGLNAMEEHGFSAAVIAGIRASLK